MKIFVVFVILVHVAPCVHPEFNHSLTFFGRSSTESTIRLVSVKMTTPDKMSLKEENDSENVTAALDKMSLKEEKDGDEMANHPHELSVTIGTSKEEWKHRCEKPCTVLEVVKSNHEELERPDNQIIIQLGKADKKFIIATHFPCSCVPSGESLIVLPQSKVVEASEEHKTTILSRDKYSVFYIGTTGGHNSTSKDLCKNDAAMKKFKYLCVYGEKEWTVKEALKRDGRFIDNLGNFFLSEDENADRKIRCAEKVDVLDKKKFKLCLPPEKTENNKKKQKNQQPSKTSQNSCGTEAVSKAASQRGISVKTKVKNSGSSPDLERIYELLREQFPALKQWMESRFPGSSYQETLNLRTENFGKIQKLFNEVHRVRKLLELGESVCKVVVENGETGTGFVLFDNLILTNAHLFKGCVEGGSLKEGINVYTLFNYDDPEPHTNYYYFELAQEKYFHYNQDEHDYAIYELNPEGKKPNQTAEAKKMTVPPGLLKHFGPVPENGEACLIGHPERGLKKIDPTCIIEKENREQAVSDHIYPYKDLLFTVTSITHLLEKQSIEQIMKGGSKEDTTVTYNTFMYHGSSGSPVFDADGRVFGLHTAGFTYGFQNHTQSVLELGQSLLTIFKHFVCKLKERNDELLLSRVKEEAKGNSDLQKVLRPELLSGSGGVVKIEPADSEEPMDTC